MESLRPDVVTKRAAFLRVVKRIPAQRLVFVDEAGFNHSMTRSHAWVKCGEEFVERLPMNWGKNLTAIGAIRLSGWVVQSTMFDSANADRFVEWLNKRLLPKLRRGDVIIMDNAKPHHDARVRPSCEARGVRLIYLPPYSPDFNPIEPGWAVQKQCVRACAPREKHALRRVVRRARHRVTKQHCQRFFKHAGYRVQPR